MRAKGHITSRTLIIPAETGPFQWPEGFHGRSPVEVAIAPVQQIPVVYICGLNYVDAPLDSIVHHVAGGRVRGHRGGESRGWEIQASIHADGQDLGVGEDDVSCNITESRGAGDLAHDRDVRPRRAVQVQEDRRAHAHYQVRLDTLHQGDEYRGGQRREIGPGSAGVRRSTAPASKLGSPYTPRGVKPYALARSLILLRSAAQRRATSLP